MDERDITIEDDSPISEAELAETTINLTPSGGDFEIDHTFFGLNRRVRARARLS